MSAVSDDVHLEGIAGLGAAILLQAAADWRQAVKHAGDFTRLNNSELMDADEVKAEVEAFLQGRYCDTICPGVGPRLLAMLREGK